MLIVHAAGDLRDGTWQVIDIRESHDDAERATAEGLPRIKEVHGDDFELPPPTTYELHSVIRG